MINIDRENVTFEGGIKDINAEWIVATIALYKLLRSAGNDDETIEDLFLEELKLAFAMMDE